MNGREASGGGRIPGPGRFFGPCAIPCRHAECAGQRARAAEDCHLCGNPIGFDEPFNEIYGGKAHVYCAEDKALLAALTRENSFAAT